MMFIETRGNDQSFPSRVPFSHAICHPSASFGGLFVPESVPTLDEGFWERGTSLSYKELAKEILVAFGIDIDEGIIDEALSTYDAFDDANDPVPVVKIGDDLFVSELYHGPTRAFKDMALQPFGTLFSRLAQKEGKHYLILAATSGDTGPAALKTFQDKENIRVVCLYPDGGTSDVQRLQMVTMPGDNLCVLGVKGNFDDTQSALKALLASSSFKAKLAQNDLFVSAANSVNFGRIIFQIIYHFWSYFSLVRQGAITNKTKVKMVVPSGNFGNALGAYYAKRMGLPVAQIIASSNANNILTELITTGMYDLRGRTLIQTLSPAMDILISSNVERILFDKFGQERCKCLMEQLRDERYFALTAEELFALREDFDAVSTVDAEDVTTIGASIAQGYVMDPHTATGVKAYQMMGDGTTPFILYSTAEWTKFSPTIAKAMGVENLHDQEALQVVKSGTNVSIVPSIDALFDASVRHTTIIEASQIEASVLAFLGV